MFAHDALAHPDPRRWLCAAAFAAGALALAGCSFTTEDATSLGTLIDTAESTAAEEISSATLTDDAEGLSPFATGTSAASSEAAAGLRPLGDTDTEMKTLRPEPDAALTVTSVRICHHDGFDRVVFDLEGSGDPGWFMDYADSPTQQASGRLVEYQGNTAINVNLDGMRYPFETGIEEPTITTEENCQPTIVTDVVSAGTFEGRSQFVIGLSSRGAYSAQLLQDPKRVVVDIVQG